MIVKYRSWDNSIVFPLKIGPFILADFSAAVQEWQKKRPYDNLTLDFSAVSKPYANGMLGILAIIYYYRTKGFKIKARLPNDNNVRTLFRSTNWAHFLEPTGNPKSESKHDRHLVTRHFSRYEELYSIVKDFMDVILGNMLIPKDVVTALEWSINEICDNVLNHSESSAGGFVQVMTFVKKEMISFTVADAGRGILNSLKEGIPTLRTDVQAIGEAIKAGVTRNSNDGQGNGLAGSLRITTMTGGSLDITSGMARILATAGGTRHTESSNNQSFRGTSVSGTIKMNKKFSVSDALNFGAPFPYASSNIIDTKYEMDDQDCLKVKMQEETTGVGTRKAGKQLMTKILNLRESKPAYPIYVDWEGIPVISSSFADEFMGKLFVALGPLSFGATIRNNNMEPLVRQLLDKAISQRLTQSNSEL